jgi:hypothetical protein
VGRSSAALGDWCPKLQDHSGVSLYSTLSSAALGDWCPKLQDHSGVSLYSTLSSSHPNSHAVACVVNLNALNFTRTFIPWLQKVNLIVSVLFSPS